MSLNLKVINPLEYSSWNKLLLSNSDYSFFLSSNWAQALHESYGYAPRYYIQVENDKLSLLLPFMEIHSVFTGRRGVSLPFSDYCEPIVPETVPSEKLLTLLIEHGKDSKWKSLEFRGGNRAFLKYFDPYSSYLGHTLTLDINEDKIFSLFSGSTRRNIKKAKREKVKINIENTLESLREYYKLHCLTRKRHGLPVQPWHFFENIHRYIFSRNQGFVVLASYQNRMIAGTVYFHLGEKAIYKYGASDRTYQHLRANDLVMWEAIRWFCQNGCRSICFGRTDLEHTGLIQFKAGWGGVERTIRYYKYMLEEEIFLKEDKKTDRLFNTVLKSSPISILRFIGNVSYRHFG